MSIYYVSGTVLHDIKFNEESLNLIYQLDLKENLSTLLKITQVIFSGREV